MQSALERHAGLSGRCSASCSTSSRAVPSLATWGGCPRPVPMRQLLGHSLHAQQHHKRRDVQQCVAAAEAPTTHWWDKGAPNMREVSGAQELVDALAAAGDKLVIVDFWAPWCGACRALYPKLVRLMEEHSDVEFLKVNFEENKPLCKNLGVKVLPYFHFYHGAEGRVAAFSCTVTKLARMREALENFDIPFCSLGPIPYLLELPDVRPVIAQQHPIDATRLSLNTIDDENDDSLTRRVSRAHMPSPAGVA